ncbi:MAG: FAD-binding protein, partial [Desulfobacterales bacterium]|nr:FAD-binding protein [Desulfobacterales bacterium]
IGAGGAGLRAAIAASNENVEVLVVSKGHFPEECNTAAAGGAMLAPLGKNDSWEQYMSDILKAGSSVNYHHLVKVMARDAGPRALDLERYGAKYFRKDGEIYLWPSNDNQRPRVLPAGTPYSGDWFKALTGEAQRLDIKVQDRVMITGLLKSGATVIGAIGLEIETESIIVIYAKSVILTSGGAGSIYTFSSNQKGTTGDGLVLAYKAGAALSHLEFVQMRQCIIYPHELKGMLPPFDGFVSAGGRFYNGLHERYMKRYHPDNLENVTRAEIAKCAQLEIIAERESTHGGIYGDLSGVPEKSLNRVKNFMSACRKIDFDPTFQSLEWAPASHHTMGGVLINASCQTGVLGLFAAGEVAAGVQGANRMGGNALTETQVFGAIAGKSAAKRALTTEPPQPNPQFPKELSAHIATILRTKNGTSYQKVRAKIARIMSEDIGVIRHKEGLENAEKLLAEIEATQISNLFLGWDRTFDRIAQLFEVPNMLALGQLMVQATLLRTESRGAHQRQDFPETDPSWEKHIVFRSSMVGPEVRTVPATYTEP